MKPIVLGAAIALLSLPVTAEARPHHGHYHGHKKLKVHHPIEYHLQHSYYDGRKYRGYRHHTRKWKRLRHRFKHKRRYVTPVYYSPPSYYCPKRGRYVTASTIRIGY